MENSAAENMPHENSDGTNDCNYIHEKDAFVRMPFTKILHNVLGSGYSQVFQWRIGLRFKNLCAGSVEFQTGRTDEFRHLPCIVHTIILIHALISYYQATFFSVFV